MTASPNSRRIPAALTTALILAAALALACSSDEPVDNGATPPDAGEALTILTTDGDVTLRAEIADTPEVRAEGLMGRTELAADSGMLFVIEPPGRGFWMRGTTLPLTVAFIADCGEIVDFADLEPLSEEIKNTAQRYVFALEMERGWFAARGVTVGDVVQLPAHLQPEGC